MTEKLFSYGTLQIESVQIKNLGRKLTPHADLLLQYELRDCLIRDPEVVNTSGKAIHPMACFTANQNDAVSGTTFDISLEELHKIDQYEVADYKRIQCTLKSGESAWVYVQSGLHIDTRYLNKESVRLEAYQEGHASDQSKPDQDPLVKCTTNDNARYPFTVYYQNTIVGSTSYYNVDLQRLSMHIDYPSLHPDHSDTDINVIVLKILLSYAFEQLKFKHVSFCVDDENLRSSTAIDKLGISLESSLKKQEIKTDGNNKDSIIYAITDELWKANKIM